MRWTDELQKILMQLHKALTLKIMSTLEKRRLLCLNQSYN